MATLHDTLQAQRAEGPATVLAIGTAVPVNSVEQSTFPDYYFRNTDSACVAHLKPKFERICENSTIKRRHIHLTEDLLKENPNMATYSAPSLNARQDMLATAVPMLAKEAAEKAIKEWGQPLSNITHLIFCTTSGIHMPGADFHLAKLLGLCPSVNRLMLYQQGCHGGGTALRMAKDLAENNAGARVLAVCSEITAVTIFRGPNETHTDNLVGQALFGDGAGAVVVGSDPVVGAERPLFQLVSASQAFTPDTEDMIQGHLRESGVMIRLSKDVPETVSGNIEARLKRAFGPLGITDWNSIFWIAHPGGPAILDKIESGLGLRPEKLRLSRHSLSEYGNVWSTSVLLIMDEMKKSSAKEGLNTTGEGLDLGVLFGFGPGLTVETVVLRSMSIN